MNHSRAFEVEALHFADGELNAADAAKFEAHLAGCAECKALVEDHRNALRLVRAGMAIDPGRSGVTVDSIQLRVRSRRSRLHSAAFAASGLVVAIAAVAWFRATQFEQPASLEAVVEDDLELRVLERRIASLEAELEAMRAETQRMSEWAAMEAEWSDRELAAIALAAARNLETSGLDVEGARRQYQLVIEHFETTPEAATAREYLAAT